MRLICDIETNNLLYECSKIHCLAIRDLDSDYNKLLVGHGEILKFLNEDLKKEDELIWHNGFVFDLEVIKKLYNVDLNKTHKIHDTIILSQVFFGDLKNMDFEKFNTPKKYIGSHSLAAWGHRLQCFKGEYKGGFEEYNEEMGQYCVQDTEVTKQVFLYFEKIKEERILREDCINLEYEVAPILARQQAFGVKFNTARAQELEAILQAEKVRIRQELQKLFKPRVIDLGEFTPKVTRKDLGTSKGRVYNKIKFEEYNPSSRKQTMDRLCKELGWEPQEFTDKGNPQLDEEIIEALPFKEIEPLKNYYILDKRLGQLANGAKAWLKVVKPDDRIYGSVLQSGTVTGRMSHFGPNMAQVPANDKFYGKECRELFCVPEQKIMIGVDADALEMRIMAGFLKPIDKGAFIRTLLEGKKELGTDMHSLNAKAYKVDHLENGRDCSKTLFYAALYGAKNPKLGLILQQYGLNFSEYVTDFDNEFENLKRWSEKKKIGFSDKYLECLLAGKTARENYGKKMPHLPELIKNVTGKWKERGYLIGLDGRKLFPRSEHAVFNILNQSAGAIIMKKALSIADKKLQDKLVPGKNYEFILNVHDEWQLECVDREDVIRYTETILVESIVEAGEFFKWPCPMAANTNKGYNWSETH